MRALAAWLLLLSILVQTSPLPRAHAHDDAGGPPTGAMADPSIQSLHEHLEKVLARSVRGGVDTQTEDEEKAGDLLVTAAYNDVVDVLKILPPNHAQDALRILKSIAHGINPVAIGKWLLETARRKGPGLAIAYGASEVAEDIGLMLSAKYPALLFLVPLSVTHATDVIVLSLAFGVPHAIRLAKLWHRFGGPLEGPRNYYNQLLDQRRVLPIDWSEVVDLDSVKADLGSGAAEEIQFAIIQEGIVERNLPRALKLIFSPRKLAQRESVPTFSIHELEELAKSGGASLKPLRAFKGNPQLYATFLIREISLNHESAVAFASEARVRHEETARSGVGGVVRPDNAWGRAKLIDAARLLDVKSVEELEKIADDANESPDLIAQRAVWYLRDLGGELYERQKGVTKEQKADPLVKLSIVRKALRDLSRLVDTNASLARIVNSPAASQGEREWNTLFDELKRAAGLVETARDWMPADPNEDTSECEKLLLGA